MSFECSCRAGPGLHLNGGLYLFAPPFILTWVVNAIEVLSDRVIFYNCHYRVCSCILGWIINYVCLGVVWGATVLFDGDWYVCLMTHYNVSLAGIPCKRNLTYKEQLLKIQYKTDSLDIGFGLICGFILVWSIGEQSIRCCVKRCLHKRYRYHICPPPYYKVLYEDLLADSVSCHLKNELSKTAKAKANAICKNFLQDITEHEKRLNNPSHGPDDVNNKALVAWQNISDTDFYLMDEHMTQEDLVITFQNMLSEDVSTSL
ncbi:hypothetical protein L3Q82_017309 [Scomber scombrus]|uniref:Uncharacterized protein n=1 Tax=Scomber scombrus TaxID=13677 RepID=A0AAV1PB35_SCOSC